MRVSVRMHTLAPLVLFSFVRCSIEMLSYLDSFIFQCLITMPRNYIRRQELALVTDEEISRAKALIERGKSKRVLVSQVFENNLN